MRVAGSESATGGGEESQGIAVHVEDGPGPFGIYPWPLVGVGAVSEVAHGRRVRSGPPRRCCSSSSC
jgi:hypothetical protein